MNIKYTWEIEWRGRQGNGQEAESLRCLGRGGPPVEEKNEMAASQRERNLAAETRSRARSRWVFGRLLDS
jgi:hypothetical protein